MFGQWLALRPRLSASSHRSGSSGTNGQALSSRPLPTSPAYSPGPIAPGEMVIIFGSGIEAVAVGVFATRRTLGRVATTLSNVRVLFDGTALPLIYVSQNVIAAMVPYGVNGKVTTQMQVVYAGISSDVLSEGRRHHSKARDFQCGRLWQGTSCDQQFGWLFELGG